MSSPNVVRTIISARRAISTPSLVRASGSRCASTLAGRVSAISSGQVSHRTKESLGQRQTSRAYATSTTDSSSLEDPATTRANELLELANRCLEDGDVHGAKALYAQSCKVQPTPTGWFNLGVCEYHLKSIEGAIDAWEKSLALVPSPDAHANLASALIMSKPPRPADAIKHLTAALDLSPEDPEIAFNLAAILESTDNLEPALALYERSAAGGVERAQQNVRNISAKILGKKAKEAESKA